MFGRQRKINKNLGQDTHVRTFYQGNAFKPQSTNTTQMFGGEIMYTQPEPLFKQNMVTVQLARGGKITSVAYPGAFIDPITGNMHGTYEGPIPGQMVMVGFENGNAASPFVVNKYPYQGVGNTLYESQYINPLTTSLFDATDVIMGHFSGSYFSFNTGILSGQLPGSISLNAVTEMNTNCGTDYNVMSNTNILLDALLTAEVKSALVKLTATNKIELAADVQTDITAPIIKNTASTRIELNGNTNWAVKFTEMQTAFNTLRTELNAAITVFNAHTHFVGALPSVPPAGVTSLVPSTPGIPAVADMSTAKNTTVLM